MTLLLDMPFLNLGTMHFLDLGTGSKDRKEEGGRQEREEETVSSSGQTLSLECGFVRSMSRGRLPHGVSWLRL
jgi:hypothetical protein